MVFLLSHLLLIPKLRALCLRCCPCYCCFRLALASRTCLAHCYSHFAHLLNSAAVGGEIGVAAAAVGGVIGNLLCGKEVEENGHEPLLDPYGYSFLFNFMTFFYYNCISQKTLFTCTKPKWPSDKKTKPRKWKHY